MNLVIIGRFPAATDTQIRAFLPADREVFITESDLSGPFLQSADALIPEHIQIPSFGDKALMLRMFQTGAGYGEDRAVCFSGQHGQEGSFTKWSCSRLYATIRSPALARMSLRQSHFPKQAG